jgi:phosphatidylglycerophosphate synthase
MFLNSLKWFKNPSETSPNSQKPLMFDDIFRKTKDRLFAPLARLVRGVHPNWVTLAALMVALGAAWLAFQQVTLGAALIWLVSRILDGLDGTVARLNNLQSDFGGYLDIMCDFVAYAVIPIAVVMAWPSAENWLSVAFLLATFYVNAASWMYLSSLLEKRAVGAAQRGEVTSVTMPGGVVGGTETVAFYTIFLLFPAWLSLLFWGFGGLVILTIGQRLWWAWRNLQR